MFKKIILAASAILFSAGAYASSYHHYYKKFEVTITNLTKGQSFTPILGATHSPKIAFFELGTPASAELASLAEGGDVGPLAAALTDTGLVVDAATTEGLLAPGSSVTFVVSGDYRSRFSFAAMLIPTNDTFASVNSVRLPFRGSKTFYAKAYDAGSEMNDELCENIPGPVCKGEGVSDTEGEGYVYISPGIHGEADLSASGYDWRDIVAKVEIRRVR